MSPFTRDGHLSDLGVELMLDGALAPDATSDVRTHAARCAACAARLAAAGAVSAPLAPRAPPRAANRASWWAAPPLALAAAALLAIGISGRRPDPEGDLRPKGAASAVTFEVYVDHGEVSDRLATGDRVRPGDRLGFRVATARDGDLMLVGVDGTGTAWLAWPADGRSAPVPAAAVPADVPGAVLLDDRPGPERLIAVRCDAPFRFDPLADAVERAAAEAGPDEDLPVLLDGCDQAEVVLEKEAR